MYEEAYYCYGCKRNIPTTEMAQKEVPECCGKPMEKLPLNECQKPPASAEHARFDDEDTPCDDGRTGG